MNISHSGDIRTQPLPEEQENATDTAPEADTCRELGCSATLSEPTDGDLMCTEGHRQWFF